MSLPKNLKINKYKNYSIFISDAISTNNIYEVS